MKFNRNILYQDGWITREIEEMEEDFEHQFGDDPDFDDED